MSKASDNDFPSILLSEQASAPTTPAAGKRRIYWKTDNKFYVRDESGTETEIGGGGGGAGSDTTAIHDNVASEISAVTEKVSPVSGDLLLIEDSADSNNKKRLQIGNLPTGTTIVGYQPWAMPPGMGPCDDYGSTLALAAVSAGNGDAVLCPVIVSAPMLLDTVVIRNMSTSSAREAEWRLYQDPGSTTLTQVTNAQGTWSFTPSGSGARASQSTTVPITLAPGIYWLCIRNTSTSQTFQIGTKNTTQFANNMYMTKNIAALGATLDVSSGWSKSNNVAGVVLEGRCFGVSALF